MSDEPNPPDANGTRPFRRAASTQAPEHNTNRPASRRAAPNPNAYTTADPESDTQDPVQLPASALTSAPRRSWVWRLLLAGFALGGTALAAWLVDSAIASVQAGSVLGLLTAASLALLGLALAALIIGEFVSLARLRSRTKIRVLVEQATTTRDSVQSEKALSALLAIHSRRPALAWALAQYRDAAADIPDAADKLVLYEQLVLGPLDEACVAEIRTIARRAAVLTAFAPNPILDAVFVLWLNLSIVRRVAHVQGLRPGAAASWALLRRTILAMIAAGGMEALGDMMPAAVAGSIIRTVARRVGEGAVNGILTIRIGVAALEACRPMPFAAREKPSVTALARQTVGG